MVRHDAKSGYTIITDTIELDANKYVSAAHKMSLTDVVSYQGRYICQFYHHNYTSHLNELNLGEGHLLLSISKDGQDVYQLPIPIEYYDWNNSWATIKVVSDTLYCYNKAKNFYWDEGSRQWMATDKKMSNDYYEDDTYTVHSEDRGEWGEFTRFHEKQTGFDYLFMAPMITAIKFEDAYYIVGPLQLRKVADPHKGWEMNDSIKYGKWASIAPIADIVYGTKYHNWYEYEYSNDHSQDTLFCSGFMRNGQMHFLMRGPEDTFIAKYIKGRQGSTEKVLSLGNIPVEYTQGRKDQDDLFFYFAENWTQDDILNIDQDTIRITYVKKHSDTLQYRGVEALEQVLDFVANNTGKATIEEVRAMEEKIGGIHDGLTLETNWMGHVSSDYRKKIMGPNHVLLDFEKDLEGDHERVNYYHAIDEFDSFCVSYCYLKETQRLSTVWIESYKTNFLDSEPNYRKKGRVALDSIVSRCLSVTPDSKGVWHKGDLIIKPFGSFGSKNRIIVQSKKR
jgi:hypothetical protein